MREVEVRRRILGANDVAAARLRSRLERQGTLALNLISSPGSGKTSLLEATARALSRRHRLGVVVGDVATERDADRLRALDVPARQILTGGACHLDARMVSHALEDAAFSSLDILFIENIGNLICPASYDLGEDFKVALLSVAEGEDKPFKYPGIFSLAEVTVITKADLLPYLTFDMEAVARQIRLLNPRGTLLVTSARTGDGMEGWLALLQQRLSAKPGATAATGS